MTDEQRKILENSISSNFQLLEKTRDTIYNDNFSLGMASFDLLKNMSGFVMGFAAIGYLYESDKLDHTFLFLAFIFGLSTLVLSVLWNKENIEKTKESNDKIMARAEAEIGEDIQKAEDALQSGKEYIYFDYARLKYKKIKSENSTFHSEKDYMLSFVTFLFLSAIGFVILSLFKDLHFIFKICFGIMVIDLSLCAVYYGWATKINNLLNTIFNKK